MVLLCWSSPTSCGLVKFKLLWFPGGLANSLVKVCILLSFSCPLLQPLPFSPWWHMQSFSTWTMVVWVRYGLFPHSSKIHTFFAFEYSIFLCRLTMGQIKGGYKHNIWDLFSSSTFAVSSRVRSSQPWCLSPVDGTAAKLSGYTATNFTCQLQLPKKKVQMYLFHPGSEGFFSRSVQRPDAVCVTQRENINNQYAHRPVADGSKSSKHTAAIPLLKSIPIQITLLLPWKHNDHGFGDKQPKTEHFCCLSRFVLQLLRLQAIKSSAYILYYYVCLPLTYQKANNIN